MGLIKSGEIFTDALPAICAGKGCLESPKKGDKYCSACGEKRLASKQRRRDVVRYLRNVSNPSDSERCLIYFIQSGKAGKIKIGRTKHIKRRLQELQISSAESLYLVATLDATGRFERMIHDYLDLDAVRGEWFEPSERLWKLIGLVQAGDFNGVINLLTQEMR